MSQSKVYYGCARERALNARGVAYRLIPRRHMPAIRLAYRERRKPMAMTDPQQVRIGMTAMLHARATETVLLNGERIKTSASIELVEPVDYLRRIK